MFDTSLIVRFGSRLLAACLLLLPTTGVLAAQGVVSGRVVVLENAGARTTDLANAVIALEPASRAGVRTGAPVRIAMASREFMPAVRIVTAGTRVEFPNDDPFRHNVFSNAGPREFDLGLYGRGETRGVSFPRAGVHPIFCNIHARMVAFVVVVETPWFAQAGADGRFSVANVPAGRYTLRAWHDRGGEHVQELVVPAGGVHDLAVQLDARGHRPGQHLNKFGQEYRAASRDRY